MSLDSKYQSTSGALPLCKLNLRPRKVPEHEQLPTEKVFRKITVGLQACSVLVISAVVLLLDSTKNYGMRTCRC